VAAEAAGPIVSSAFSLHFFWKSAAGLCISRPSGGKNRAFSIFGADLSGKSRSGVFQLRALALFSGGLDSILAVRVLLDQAIEVEALTFVHSLFAPSNNPLRAALSAADQLGVNLHTVEIDEEFLAIVKNPRHGYGSGCNPCIDCRILILRKAREFMDAVGAKFLVTGEVLGERPMSQRRDALNLIEKEAGVRGLVLRPLSAKLLEPTIPEKEGWVDREKLLDIRGRKRTPQMELAARYGITRYPSPAGGCLLTDPAFARRMRDLLEHQADFSLDDVELLKVGRHFRLAPDAKAVVGRNEAENKRLREICRPDDTLLAAVDFPGPLVVLRGAPRGDVVELAASLTARYGKGRNLPQVRIAVFDKSQTRRREIAVAPLGDERLGEFRIDLVETPRKKRKYR